MHEVRAFRRGGRRRGRRWASRRIVAPLLAGLSLGAYWICFGEGGSVREPTRDQEIALGILGAPEFAARHEGIDPDPVARERVERVGRRVVERSRAANAGYPFEFHALADRSAACAWSLPGGQVFVTTGLRERLRTEGELAWVLAHEVAHVVERHAAEHLARAGLDGGLDPETAIEEHDPAVAAMIAHLIGARFEREAELESDRLAAQYVSEAGYDPRASVELLRRLRTSEDEPEILVRHPAAEGRIERLEQAVRELYPEGVPADLTP